MKFWRLRLAEPGCDHDHLLVRVQNTTSDCQTIIIGNISENRSCELSQQTAASQVLTTISGRFISSLDCRTGQELPDWTQWEPMTKALMEAISSGSAVGPFGLIYKEKHHVKLGQRLDLWICSGLQSRTQTGPVPVPVRPVTCMCFMCFRLKLLCVTLNSADDFCVEAAVIKHVDKSNKRTKTI